MHKLIPLVAAVFGCSLSIAGAAATMIGGNNFSAPEGTPIANVITDQFGTPLANTTGIASLGYFGSFSDAQVDSLVASSNFSSLISDFIGLANNTFGTHGSVPSFAGFYEAIYNNPAALDYTNDGGKHMYSFYADTLTLAGADELGLYRHDDTISIIDPSPDPTDSYSLLNYSDGSDGDILIGTSGTNDYDFGGNVFSIDSMALVAIPEPSTSLLALVGIAGLLRRRR